MPSANGEVCNCNCNAVRQRLHFQELCRPLELIRLDVFTAPAVENLNFGQIMQMLDRANLLHGGVA
jgi:hypothetical protein